MKNIMKLWTLLTLQIMALFISGMMMSYVNDTLQSCGFFGDIRRSIKSDIDPIDPWYDWGARHYWYFWMMVVLFILVVIRIIMWVDWYTAKMKNEK